MLDTSIGGRDTTRPFFEGVFFFFFDRVPFMPSYCVSAPRLVPLATCSDSQPHQSLECVDERDAQGD